MTDASDKPRGLWNLMNRRPPGETPDDDGQASDVPKRTESDDETALDSPDRQPDADDAEPPSPPKGLWSVMRQGQTVGKEPNTADDFDDNAPARDAAIEEQAESSSDAVSPKGLWGVISAGDAAVRDSATGEIHDHRADAQEYAATVAPPSTEIFVTTDSTPAFMQVVVQTGRSQMASAASVVGLLAVPLSALALLPDAWLRLPATIAGFAALMLGLLGWQEVRSSRGRRTGSELAAAGMVLGVLAMFLGPIVFARVGQGYRKSFGQQQTITNLETIGSGLQSYHRKQEHYPSGGIFRVDGNGAQLPMHGWMASLLPYLGEQELHNSIRFDIPYGDPANLPAMRRNVHAFLAAGGDRSPIGRQKFAPAHFAGLGGELNIEGVGLVKVGVFGRNSDMTRDDVTDGLSQTLVVGEIAAFYPAWGEPENWRMMGRGLNRDPDGFGNAADTGALFLKADGSVKFYSNKTDSAILRMLSTPNAGDLVTDENR
jgi:hypothetical protein